MKTIFGFFLVFVASSSFAAAVPLFPGTGIAATSSGFTTAANFTGQFSAAAFNSNFTTNVGGKAVTMPAAMRLAANAGQFAVSAVRLNPAALVGTAVASWLLGYGLEWINGQWQKSESASVPSDALCGMTALQCATSGGSPSYATLSPRWIGISGGSCIAGLPDYPHITIPCGMTGQPQKRPATETDWAAIPQNAPLPDPVAGELASKGVPLPLEVPHIGPQDIPLGDPYVDPVTGKRYQDKARVTPRADSKTADVQTYKQEVDEAGNPKKQEDGQTEKPPEEQTDFCKKNPDAISCMPEGQTDDQELQTKNIGSGITPVSVGGQGQCMADKTLSMATMGKSITFTYKPICDLASMVRPLILALAWLLAGWIMVGAVKDN